MAQNLTYKSYFCLATVSFVLQHNMAFGLLAMLNEPPVVDPETTMGPASMIQHWGYPVERYEVTTEDSYILSIYRIPHGKNETVSNGHRKKPVVFFQHGLEGSCTNWLENMPHQSAAYIFADAGFDVYLGNFRGSSYSKTHRTLTSADQAYWQFSWDQMARYDLPAMLYEALNISGAEKLYYIGHSMGTMTAFAKFSQDKQLARRVKQFYALGPVSTLHHVKGPLKIIAPFTKSLHNFLNMVGYNEFLPSNRFMEMLAKTFCANPKTSVVCTNILFLVAGPDTRQINITRMPVYVAHTPAGTSTQNIVHFGQMVNSGKFQMFDYGTDEDNVKYYKKKEPPTYDMSKMETPVALYWGNSDWLANPTDVLSASANMRNIFDNVYLSDFNHLDFIWGLRAAPEVYQPILKSIQNDILRS